MKYIRNLLLIATIGLLVMAALGLALTVDRFVAALLNFWKFEESNRNSGIDLGANSSFFFLSICLLAVSTCIPILNFSKKWNDKLLYRLATATVVIYFFCGILMLFLVSSGLAFLYCGR